MPLISETDYKRKKTEDKKADTSTIQVDKSRIQIETEIKEAEKIVAASSWEVKARAEMDAELNEILRDDPSNDEEWLMDMIEGNGGLDKQGALVGEIERICKSLRGWESDRMYDVLQDILDKGLAYEPVLGRIRSVRRKEE